jgi:DHA2 family integral membrane protein (MFS transporter)
MVIFGGVMFSYAFATPTMPQWVIEVMMLCMGAGMGLTMSPATNAIMGAVPREKAGAGSAVNNTVRQVAGALGVAILGSILVVAFRGHLGSGTPQQLAQRLDQPAAVVSSLPADERVSSFVRSDTSQSIGNALEFAGNAGAALQSRANSGGAATIPAAELKQLKDADHAALTGFVADAKSSFMSGMHVTSIFAGLSVLLGAVVAFGFLPSRKEMQALHRDPVSVPAEPADTEPVVVH